MNAHLEEIKKVLKELNDILDEEVVNHADEVSWLLYAIDNEIMETERHIEFVEKRLRLISWLYKSTSIDTEV